MILVVTLIWYQNAAVVHDFMEAIIAYGGGSWHVGVVCFCLVGLGQMTIFVSPNHVWSLSVSLSSQKTANAKRRRPKWMPWSGRGTNFIAEFGRKDVGGGQPVSIIFCNFILADQLSGEVYISSAVLFCFVQNFLNGCGDFLCFYAFSSDALNSPVLPVWSVVSVKC